MPSVHSLFANSERKRRPKERDLTISFLWSKTMSKVVYRGQAYDTVERREQRQAQQQPQQHNEAYRGIKFVKEDK